MDSKNFYENLGEYLNVIKAFKKRYDVQNGFALGYRINQDPNGELLMKNKPHSIGEGITTTGWCVSVSQAFINDNAFKILLQYRGAQAKLISIDIKEQFWGECYNGSKNTWHTAILVNDSGVNFVIDLTCAQFGNRFVEKFIWTFETWEKTFRSPICRHIITDFDGNILTYNIVPKDKYQSYEPVVDNEKIGIKAALHKNPLLTNKELDVMTDFFAKRMDEINCKLINGTINNFDVKYIDLVTDCLGKMTVKNYVNAYYHVMKFPNKDMLKKFAKIFVKNGYVANHYMLFYDNIEGALESCINGDKINVEVPKDSDMKCCSQCVDTKVLNCQDVKEDAPHYVVFEIADFLGFDTSSIFKNSCLVPYGNQFEVTKEDIFNGVELLPPSNLNTQKTNTIYIRKLKIDKP